MAHEPRIIIALDTSNLSEAEAIVEGFGDQVEFYKVGSILFTSAGPAAVRMVRGHGKQVFLDLKFHDIPNTVMGAVAGAARLGVSLVTVHSAGGPDMMRAALEGAARQSGKGGSTSVAGSRPRVIGVTLLTSLAAGEDIGARVLALAKDAARAGLDGVVCSPLEVGAIRQALGPDFITVVPGIRRADDAKGDQARVATPGQAARDGAHFLVVGRSVTAAKNPRVALGEIVAELEAVGR
ncbi:MAG TPA: orotidine-5'-phosphate decarboxylase [bacterium]|nr:orotidine-5'-phosphate decarboxylase [bacterium]